MSQCRFTIWLETETFDVDGADYDDGDGPPKDASEFVGGLDEYRDVSEAVMNLALLVGAKIHVEDENHRHAVWSP